MLLRLSLVLLLLTAGELITNVRSAVAAPSRKPNIVIIFIDDMGYADIGPFGARAYTTPHLDQMAAEPRFGADTGRIAHCDRYDRLSHARTPRPGAYITRSS